MKKIIIYCFFILIASQAWSQITVETKLDSSVILIGDQVQLNIITKHPKGVVFNYPIIKDSIVSKIEVLETTIDTLSKSDTGWMVVHRILITSFDSGLYVLPGFKYPISYMGKTDTITSSSVQLLVNAIAVDSTSALFDIKPILNVPISWGEVLQFIKDHWRIILLGLLAIIIIIVTIIIIIKKRKNQPLFVEKKIIELPYIVAFRELEALKDQKLWQQGKVKEYHSSLTDIVRKYIEGQYQILAMESTTDEILLELKKQQFKDAELFVKLKNVLQLSDLVKFAKAIPLPNENEDSYSAAYVFVDKTKIQETLDTNNSEPSKTEKA